MGKPSSAQRLVNLMIVFVICLELAWLAAGAIDQRQQPVPPLPDLSRLDAISRDELLDLRSKLNPRSAYDWLQLAALFNVHGYFPEAELCAEVATQLAPVDSRTWFERGLALHQTGRMQQAIEMFERARQVADRSTSAMCSFCIGRNYLRLERPEDAEKAFRKAGSFAPAQFELAKLLLRDNRLDEAEPLVAALQKSDPAEQEYHQLEQRLAIAKGDEPRARLAEFNSEWTSDRRSTDAVIGLLGSRLLEHGLERRFAQVRALTRRQQWDTAARLAAEVVSAEWQPRYSSEVVRLHVERRDFDRAEDALEKEINFDGLTGERALMLGEIAWQRRQPDLALEHWQRSLALEPFGLAAQRILDAKLLENDAEATRRMTDQANLAAVRRSLLDRKWAQAEGRLAGWDRSRTEWQLLQSALFYEGVAAFLQGDKARAHESWAALSEEVAQPGRVQRVLQLVADQPEPTADSPAD
jgi:tetratricopeptide (TPR) repeat protein